MDGHRAASRADEREGQAAIDRARATWVQAGWAIVEADQGAGRFVCEQGTDRRIVAISALPPGPRGRVR
jgi:hypothetical protein